MKNILITGATGLVGSQLSQLFIEKGYRVAHLSRSKSNDKKTFLWDYKKEFIEKEALFWADIIVHLAGTSVADKRWSKDQKKDIYESRVLGTRFLKKAIEDSGVRIDYFLSASAIGIYDQASNKEMEENSEFGTDFLANVVKDWEKEIFSEVDYPTAALRIGLVLSKNGGAYPKLSAPVRLGFGANLGSGLQYMPWIHIDDLCAMFVFAVENNLVGRYNAVSPEKITHNEFNQKIALSLGKKIWLPNIPVFILKVLFGEMAGILVTGAPVSPKLIISKGFSFKYTTLSEALITLK